MMIACDNCRMPFHESEIDSKPERLAGPGAWWQRLPPLNLRKRALDEAAYLNEDFDRMECRACYGPGFTEGQ